LGPDFRQLRRNAIASLLPVCLTPAQAEAEADWLIEFLTGLRPGQHVIGQAVQLDFQTMKDRLNELIQRRLTERIPIQYLLNEAWFYGYRFTVTPDVLIPRPETELLVEAVILKAKAIQNCRILDFGTGSGCIAIALAMELGNAATISALDISESALTVARQNAQDLGASVRFIHSEGFSRLSNDDQFDIIVSNPPYIDPKLMPTLQPEVREHEPHQALFPPSPDAFWFYRLLGEQSPGFLASGGFLLAETGDDMASTIAQLWQCSGFQTIQTLADYSGQARIISARW
jgi:release factor glutamine methyltransferase